MDLTLGASVLACTALLVALYYAFRPQRSRNYKNEDSVLAELEVYQCYGQQKKARELLKEAVAANPKSWVYKDRLAHMK